MKLWRIKMVPIFGPIIMKSCHLERYRMSDWRLQACIGSTKAHRKIRKHWKRSMNLFSAWAQLLSAALIAPSFIYLFWSHQESRRHGCCMITRCAVEQRCCKGDQPFQWENPKFDPPVYPKSLNFSR